MDVSSIIHEPSMQPSRHSNRRTRSFCGYPSSPSSSIGSSTSSSNLDSPLSPISPLQFDGVPFKWEEQPGIPKQYSTSPKVQIIKQSPIWDPLPPPPAGPPQRFLSSVWKKKLYHEAKLGKDPFMAALVACSRPDEYWKGSRVSRTLSARLGSCKSNSCIVESTVLIPRSSRSSYEMLNRRM